MAGWIILPNTMQAPSILPTPLETPRLQLRSLQPGDGPWYFAAGQRNRAHLERFESGNVLMALRNEEDAEGIVRDLAVLWERGEGFFLVAFEKASGAFVAQVYVGPEDRTKGVYRIGYVADCRHEGRGHVTEAVQAVLPHVFSRLAARRIILECDEANVRSRRVAERCGFTREGATDGALCFALSGPEDDAGRTPPLPARNPEE